MLLVVSGKELLAYIAAAVIPLLLVVYATCALPVLALFRKPIEESAECPLCGSKDFRLSYLMSPMDRVRKFLGLYAFRCRGCTKRFIRKARNQMQFATEP